MRLLSWLLRFNHNWLMWKLLWKSMATPYWHLPGYMDRYWLFKTRWLQARFHVIHRGDKGRDLHDHPFTFTSLILWGGYLEIKERADGTIGSTAHRAGSINTCNNRDFHRICTVIGAQPCITLVFIWGRGKKSWGFKTKNGFVPHEDYRYESAD